MPGIASCKYDFREIEGAACNACRYEGLFKQNLKQILLHVKKNC